MDTVDERSEILFVAIHVLPKSRLPHRAFSSLRSNLRQRFAFLDGARILATDHYRARQRGGRRIVDRRVSPDLTEEIVVTRNARDFERTGVEIVNPWT